MPSSGVSEDSYSVLLYINTKLKKKVKSTGLLLQKTQNWFQASTWWLPNICRDLILSPNFWVHQTLSGVHICRLAKCSYLTIDQRNKFENGQKHNNNTNIINLENNKGWEGSHHFRLVYERGYLQQIPSTNSLAHFLTSHQENNPDLAMCPLRVWHWASGTECSIPQMCLLQSSVKWAQSVLTYTHPMRDGNTKQTVLNFEMSCLGELQPESLVQREHT